MHLFKKKKKKQKKEKPENDYLTGQKEWKQKSKNATKTLNIPFNFQAVCFIYLKKLENTAKR